MLRPSKRTKCNQRRSSFMRPMTGSGIVEGVVGLVLIIGTTVLASLLLINTGVATYNKEKIGFVADQAAAFATSCTNMSTRQADVSSFVDNLLTQMGLNASNTNVTVSDVAVGQWAAVSVSVTSNLPTIMSSGFSNLLPQQIQVSDTAVSIKSPYVSQYIVGVDPFGGTVTCALIDPTGNLPPDGLEAWRMSLTGTKRIR